MARSKQEQTRLQGASGQLKPYKKLLLYFKSFVDMDTMENCFTSLQKANQTWNIPFTSLSNHLTSKTRSMKHGPPSALTHEEDLAIVG